MVEIFINNKKLDLPQDLSIALNYSAIEIDKPTATRNAYSKTISVSGTKNNNEIFGNLWKLDSNNTNFDFDAKKRVDAVITVDGTIVHKGYIQMDEISYKSGKITYSFTFFGNTGDFFYNLMYDNEGNEKTLASLYYGFTNNFDEPMSAGEENIATLARWESDWIYHSWDLLEDSQDKTDMRPVNWITAIPTYSGLYDNFASNKVLVNLMYYSDQVTPRPPAGLKELFPNTLDGKKFGSLKYNSWRLVEAGRDLVEAETKDYRANQQQIGVRTNLILNAISNPENNGGYEIIWDEEFKNSKEFNETFVLLGKPDLSDNNRIDAIQTIDWQISAPIITKSLVTLPQNLYVNSWKTFYLADSTSKNPTFNLAGTEKPRITFELLPSFKFNSKTSDSYKFVNLSYSENVTNAISVGGFGINVEIYSNGTKISNEPYYFYTTEPVYAFNNSYYTRSIRRFNQENYRGGIMTQMGIQTNFLIKETKPFQVLVNQDGRYYSAIDPIKFDLDLPQSNNVQVRIKMGYFTYVNGNNKFPASTPSVCWNVGYNGSSTNTTRNYELDSYEVWSMTNNFTINTTHGIFEGESDGLKSNNISKTMLFKKSISPFTFLTSFTKMFGLKFECDNFLKKIYIKQRKNFYNNKIVNIDEKIDYDKGYTINPVITEKKWMNFGLETPETYADYLYKKKTTKKQYGALKLNTNMDFNNDTQEAFEDNSFKNLIPYKLQSPVFSNPKIVGTNTVYPACAVIEKYTSISFDEDNDSTIDVDCYGYANYNKAIPTKDTMEKICCFDKDNKLVENEGLTLLFHNGSTPVNDAILSDDNQAMYDIAGEPCWLLSYWNNLAYTTQKEADEFSRHKIGEKLSFIPNFSKYHYDIYNTDIVDSSLDFAKPDYSFIGNLNNYPENSTIYNKYWKNYVEDMYDNNGCICSTYVFLPKQDINTLFKNFYFFGGNLWVLNNISDWNPNSDGVTKCEFIKIKNKENYLT